jgi:peroxiredoxin
VPSHDGRPLKVLQPCPGQQIWRVAPQPTSMVCSTQKPPLHWAGPVQGGQLPAWARRAASTTTSITRIAHPSLRMAASSAPAYRVACRAARGYPAGVVIWVGLAIIGAAIGGFLVTLAIRRTQPLWWFDLAVVVGTLVALRGWYLDGGSVRLAAGAAVAALGWFVSTRVELTLPNPGALRVKVGDRMPEFTAATTAGGTLGAGDLIAHAPALLVLYRGWWCPYCATQLDELEREHARLAAAGITLYALSVDRPDEQVALEKRLHGRVTFLSDPEGKLLDTIGVRHKDGVPWYDRLLFKARRQDISMPTALLIGKDGRLRFVERARSIDQRPKLAAVIAATKSAS